MSLNSAEEGYGSIREAVRLCTGLSVEETKGR